MENDNKRLKRANATIKKGAFKAKNASANAVQKIKNMIANLFSKQPQSPMKPPLSFGKNQNDGQQSQKTKSSSDSNQSKNQPKANKPQEKKRSTPPKQETQEKDFQEQGKQEKDDKKHCDKNCVGQNKNAVGKAQGKDGVTDTDADGQSQCQNGKHQKANGSKTDAQSKNSSNNTEIGAKQDNLADSTQSNLSDTKQSKPSNRKQDSQSDVKQGSQRDFKQGTNAQNSTANAQSTGANTQGATQSAQSVKQSPQSTKQSNQWDESSREQGGEKSQNLNSSTKSDNATKSEFDKLKEGLQQNKRNSTNNNFGESEQLDTDAHQTRAINADSKDLQTKDVSDSESSGDIHGNANNDDEFSKDNTGTSEQQSLDGAQVEQELMRRIQEQRKLSNEKVAQQHGDGGQIGKLERIDDDEQISAFNSDVQDEKEFNSGATQTKDIQNFDTQKPENGGAEATESAKKNQLNASARSDIAKDKTDEESNDGKNVLSQTISKDETTESGNEKADEISFVDEQNDGGEKKESNTQNAGVVPKDANKIDGKGKNDESANQTILASPTKENDKKQNTMQTSLDMLDSILPNFSGEPVPFGDLNPKDVKVNEIIAKNIIQKFVRMRFKSSNSQLNSRQNATEKVSGVSKWDTMQVVKHKTTKEFNKMLKDKYDYDYDSGKQEQIPLSIYFDLSSSMNAYIPMLCALAMQLLKNDVRVIIGTNEWARLQINEISPSMTKKEFSKIIANYTRREYISEYSKKFKYEILDKNISDYLIERKAEKTLIFSDYDPCSSVCALSKTKCHVYWFNFAGVQTIYLKNFNGVIRPVSEPEDVLKALVVFTNTNYNALRYKHSKSYDETDEQKYRYNGDYYL